VRWEALFGDLEAQFQQADAAQLQAEVADRTRRELARIRLVDRLRAAVGYDLSWSVRGGVTVTARLVDVGPDWALATEDLGREVLVALPAVLWVAGLGPRAGDPDSEGAVAKRLDLRHALRGLARDRSIVSCVLVDGSLVNGTVDRVGADYVDLAEVPPGESRRGSGARIVRGVPLTALALVRRG
jgi:hypothetical protein